MEMENLLQGRIAETRLQLCFHAAYRQARALANFAVTKKITPIRCFAPTGMPENSTKNGISPEADELPVSHRHLQGCVRSSYRDLPQRYSEMGTVYRAELSGTLHGLDARSRIYAWTTRIFSVRPDQVEIEVADCSISRSRFSRLTVLKKFKFELSVRGGAENKGYLGADEDWENAENALASALKERGISYERIEGEAAFYGPKIDIKIEDAIGRIWQLGNDPTRFQFARAISSSNTRAKTIRNIARYDSPRFVRFGRKIFRRFDRTLRRRVSVLARAGAGCGSADHGPNQRICRTGCERIERIGFSR